MVLVVVVDVLVALLPSPSILLPLSPPLLTPFAARPLTPS